jgi:hypothetical protein
MDWLIYLIYLILISCAVVYSYVWSDYQNGRSVDMLTSWAFANDYLLITFERRYFFKGPFFLSFDPGQMVYFVEIQLKNGKVKPAYVKCGHPLFGMLVDEVEIKWLD